MRTRRLVFVLSMMLEVDASTLRTLLASLFLDLGRRFGGGGMILCARVYCVISVIFKHLTSIVVLFSRFIDAAREHLVHDGSMLLMYAICNALIWSMARRTGRIWHVGEIDVLRMSGRKP